MAAPATAAPVAAAAIAIIVVILVVVVVWLADKFLITFLRSANLNEQSAKSEIRMGNVLEGGRKLTALANCFTVSCGSQLSPAA